MVINYRIVHHYRSKYNKQRQRYIFPGFKSSKKNFPCGTCSCVQHQIFPIMCNTKEKIQAESKVQASLMPWPEQLLSSLHKHLNAIAKITTCDTSVILCKVFKYFQMQFNQPRKQQVRLVFEETLVTTCPLLVV